MGYSSTFRLVIFEDDTPEPSEINPYLADLSGNEQCNVPDEQIFEEFREFSEGAAYCLNNDGSSEESGKWYDAKEELTEFSKRYPYLTFDLYVEGEETLDAWHLYVRNGKSQLDKAIVTFAGCDPKLMK